MSTMASVEQVLYGARAVTIFIDGGCGVNGGARATIDIVGTRSAGCVVGGGSGGNADTGSGRGGGGWSWSSFPKLSSRRAAETTVLCAINMQVAGRDNKPTSI